ncbi:MAG: hypothetical protein FWE23_01690 [Chitinivibrionia bacterium]|nr:hypothetical protein [Chitinivibrionia bacterium]
MPVAQKIKTVLFIGFALFFGWYSKQAANNPWRMRSSFYFDDGAIIFFQENHNTRTEDYRISIPLDPSMRIIDTFFVHGWKIQNKSWGISAQANNILIVIPFEETEDFRRAQNIVSDILVVSGDSANVAEKRHIFRPKITIWYADEEESEFGARNVYIPRFDESFRLRRNRDGFLAEVLE